MKGTDPWLKLRLRNLNAVVFFLVQSSIVSVESRGNTGFSRIFAGFSRIFMGFSSTIVGFSSIFLGFSHAFFGVSRVFGGFSEMTHSMYLNNFYDARKPLRESSISAVFLGGGRSAVRP